MSSTLFRLSILFCLLCLCGTVYGQNIYNGKPGYPFVPTQFVVRYQQPMNPVDVAQLAVTISARLVEYSDTQKEFLLELKDDNNNDVCTVIGDTDTRNRLRGHSPNPPIVAPNYIAKTQHRLNGSASGGGLTTVPPLRNCGGETGNVMTSLAAGSGNVTVAVIDSRIYSQRHYHTFRRSVIYEPVTPNVYHDNPPGQLSYEHEAPERDYAAYETEEYDPIHDYHGTAVGGIIAQPFAAEGKLGQLTLLNLQVLNQHGEGTLMDLIHALDQAAGADILNMSLGFDGSGCADVALDIIQAKIAEGNYLVVASAGNDGDNISSRDIFPATMNSSNIVTVGSTNCNGTEMTSFSNFSNSEVDLLAPGGDIVAPNPNGGYYSLRGTSFSAPIITSVLAKLMTRYSRSTALQKLLQASKYVPELSYASRLGVINTNCLNTKVSCDGMYEDGPTDPGSPTGYVRESSNQQYGATLRTTATAYPNPFERTVRVMIPSPALTTHVSLLDLTGRQLRQRVVQGPSLDFDLSDLPAGQYFVVLHGDDTQRPLPIVKR